MKISRTQQKALDALRLVYAREIAEEQSRGESWHQTHGVSQYHVDAEVRRMHGYAGPSHRDFRYTTWRALETLGFVRIKTKTSHHSHYKRVNFGRDYLGRHEYSTTEYLLTPIEMDSR